MIERAEYIAMAEEAVTRFNTLSAIMPYGTEIVYVVSKEVHEAMQAYEYNFCREHAGVNIRTDGAVGTYYGTRLAFINEDIADSFFMPVVYSRSFQHHNGLQVDDFVIFNDEDNDLLFRLARLTPDTMYTDTGLTVSFVSAHMPEIAVTDNESVNLLTDATIIIGDAVRVIEQSLENINEAVADRIVGEAHDIPARYIHDATIYLNNPFNADLLKELTGEASTPHRARKRANKEKELSPGDTELIDEYLHSFMKGGC